MPLCCLWVCKNGLLSLFLPPDTDYTVYTNDNMHLMHSKTKATIINTIIKQRASCYCFFVMCIICTLFNKRRFIESMMCEWKHDKKFVCSYSDLHTPAVYIRTRKTWFAFCFVAAVARLFLFACDCLLFVKNLNETVSKFLFSANSLDLMLLMTVINADERVMPSNIMSEIFWDWWLSEQIL